MPALQLALRHVLTPEQWESLQSERGPTPSTPPPGRQEE